MSFWIVPESARAATPWRRATATYSASRMIAVALIVIDVDTGRAGCRRTASAMSSIESMATPTRPDLAGGQRVIGVVAHLRRQVEGDAQAADALASR
jgi:hypothetical protein